MIPGKRWNWLGRTSFDLAVLDYELPHMSGIALARRMKSLRPGVPLVLYSGSVSIKDEELGAVDVYVAKGETIDVLLHKLRDLLVPRKRTCAGRRRLMEDTVIAFLAFICGRITFRATLDSIFES